MKLKTKKEIRRYSHPQRTQNISKKKENSCTVSEIKNSKPWSYTIGLSNYIKLYVPSQLLNLTLHWKKEARAV